MDSTRTAAGTGAAGPADPRREREHRFLVDDAIARRVLRQTRGRLKQVMYQPEKAVAYARTIYLDTHERRFLQSYSSGTAIKLRIRQYASAEDLLAPPRITTACYLELKRSAGVERHKVRLELFTDDAASLVRGPIAPALLSRLSREPALDDVIEDLRTGALTPQVTSWYRRVALEAEGVRLTIDEAIAFCRPTAPGAPGDLAEPSGTLALEPHTILEIKVKSTMPDWLSGAVSDLTPTTNYSKFRAAMAAAGTPTANKPDGTLKIPVLS